MVRLTGFAVVLSVWLNLLQRKISLSLEGGQGTPSREKAFPTFKRTQEKKRGHRRAWAQGSRARPGTRPDRAGSSLLGQRGCSRAESGPDPVPPWFPSGVTAAKLA